MKLLKRYLFKQLALSFFPIFLTLFFITSIVFLVKIASLTSIIKIDFFELMQLYSYTLANILFLTLPISFFASTVIALSKLSSEYELIIITSFGLRPFEILKMLLPITFLLSITLLIISLGLIPKSEHLNNQFIAYKQTQAQFNIKASQYGQSFGDWVIYMDEKKNNTYNNIKLFQTKNNTDQFILARNAVIQDKNNSLSLKLIEGKTLIINPYDLNQINFNTMNIYNTVSKYGFLPFSNSLNYWITYLPKLDKFKQNFSYYILISLFPLISLLLVLVFSYYNPRYDKNKATFYAIAAITVYYIFSYSLSKQLLFYSLFIVPFVWMSIIYIYYYKQLKPLY
ncbi:MAG: LptF/LptG family permease [Campylobacterota bacterium]|nr:LptF/LptG family permease [Campylobacterota bacterium]